MRVKRKGIKIVFGLVGGYLAVVLLSVPIFLWLLNSGLSDIDGYSGKADLAYVTPIPPQVFVHGIEIQKSPNALKRDFLKIDFAHVDLSWSDLLVGRVSLDLLISGLELNFIDSEKEEKQQLGRGIDIAQIIKKWLPTEVDELELRDSRIRFFNFDGKKDVRIELSDLDLYLNNFAVSKRTRQEVADFNLAAKLTGGGEVFLSAVFVAALGVYNGKLKFKVSEVDLPAYNDLLRHYFDVDVETGRFYMVGELNSSASQYEGYMKPVIRDFDVFDFDKDVEAKSGGLGNLIFEGGMNVISSIVTNEKKDQIGSKVPLQIQTEEGQTEVELFESISSLLRNAFVEALELEFE